MGSAADGVGQQGQFALGPQCLCVCVWGGGGTKSFILLYCEFQVSLLFCFALTLLTQTSKYTLYLM